MAGEDDEIDEVVKQSGWQTLTIGDHSPPFAYTVGLMLTWRHPEIIVFGWEPRFAGGLIAWLVQMINAGRHFDHSEQACEIDELLNGNRIQLAIRTVHATQHQFYLGYSMAFARRHPEAGELKAVQVFWPDENGRFPFDANCSENTFLNQPRLDIPKTSREIKEFERLWR